MLHWARTSRQPFVFLKLDFSKTYDKASWWFLFLAIHKMGISDQFFTWVKLLFINDYVVVNLNDSPWENFKVKRGAWQGCPLALYLFLIVEEVFTHVINKAVKGRLKGVVLPGERNNKAYRNMQMTHSSWSVGIRSIFTNIFLAKHHQWR